MLTKNEETTSAMPSKTEAIALIFSISFRIFSAQVLYHKAKGKTTPSLVRFPRDPSPEN